MKVASLFSGGKDSTFSIYKMQQARPRGSLPDFNCTHVLKKV